MYFKQIENELIIAVGTASQISGADIEITAEEYEAILDRIKSKPADTEDIVYKLAINGLYIPFEREAEEEPDPFENEDYAAGYEQALLDMMELEEEE